MPIARRALGGVSRRLGRPELLAAFYPEARQALRDEVAIAAVLASSLCGDGAYVDIGANRGQILREAVRVAPRGSHLAFEPIPAIAAELARAYPSVDCRQMALGARADVAQFCHFRKLDGWSGLRQSPGISDERGDPEYITVTVSTLDDEVGDRAPRVIKIDVEGAELEVLEGGRALLARVKPVVIFEHVASAAALYGCVPGAVWDLFSELGYEVFTATGDGPFTRETFAQSAKVINWLATPAAVAV
jgi:FkbM family methyltransferase